MIAYPEQDLVESVKALPAERYAEVREFINLLTQSNELVAKAMAWIAERLPDRYCAGEPRFEVRTLSWRVPILLSYPNGKGGEVGALAGGNLRKSCDMPKPRGSWDWKTPANIILPSRN